MAPLLEERTYTPEEYLDLELISETRSEYRNGIIVPMTGGTPDHNELAVNLATCLKVALRGKPYRIFATDQRLWIPDRKLYTYPDIMVAQKPLQLQAGRKDTVINSCFLAEVLSKSTQDYDHGEKFTAYRTIGRFYEYLLIDQYDIHVEHYVKTAENQWLLSEYRESSATVFLKIFDTPIRLIDLYDNIGLN